MKDDLNEKISSNGLFIFFLIGGNCSVLFLLFLTGACFETENTTSFLAGIACAAWLLSVVWLAGKSAYWLGTIQTQAKLYRYDLGKGLKNGQEHD